MDIVILTQADMERVFTMQDAIKADKDAFRLYSAGQSDIPLRANLAVPEHDGHSLYMYGYAAPANALGVKIVSVYPRNAEKGLNSVPASMVLVNAETGEVCALMDGTYLTRVRTAAAAGAATELLSRGDSRVFAMFGTGGQAEHQLEAVLTVRPIELVKVYSRHLDRTEAFAKRMEAKFGAKFNVKIVAAKSAAEAIENADIVTAVTTANDPVFDGRLLKAGAHINGVGSYTPDMSEVDEYTVTHSAKVYVDTRDGALNEAGDLMQPIARGTFAASKVTGELGELIAGNIPGRESDAEQTLFITTGTAVLDIVTAQRIYERALEKGIGSVVKL